MRNIITQWILKKFLSGMVLSIPDLATNTEARRGILESAKPALQNEANKYVRDSIIIATRDTICFKTKNEYEIAYNRGIIRGVQLQHERLVELSLTHESKNKNDNEQSTIPRRNHG